MKEKNESSAFGYPSTSWQNLMPSDQRAKLLAMHRESTANAGMYVAVVLAVYVVLLSLLLCRYVKRRGPRESWFSCPCQTGCCRGLVSSIIHSFGASGPPPLSSLSSDSNNKDDDTHPPHQLIPLQTHREDKV